MLQHIVGIGLEAQQLCYLTTEIDQTLADLEVVLRIVMDALGILRHIELTAEFALRAIGHERRIRGEVEGEDPAFLLLFLCCQSGSFTGSLRQTVELCLVCDMQGEGLILLQEILRELQAQHRSLFRQLAQALLAFGIEQGAIPHKTVIAVVEEHFFLGCQLAMMAMHILDALKEFLVETNIIGMLCQNRTHLLRQGIHLVVGLRRQQVEEHGTHTAEQVVVILAILLVIHIDDGIVESGLFRIIDDLLDLLVVTTDTFQHGLLVVLHTDTVKGGHVVRRMVRLEERILPFSHFTHGLYFLIDCKSTKKVT